MFRNTAKLNINSLYSHSLDTLFKRYISNSLIDKEKFLKSWATLPESSRKLTAINETKPEFAEILIYKGHAYREMGEWGIAIQSYKEAAELDKNYEIKANREIEEIENLVGNKFSYPIR